MVGVTLSPAQLEYARQRMQRNGLQDQVRLELCDYRDVVGEKFDYIVSIEMFEAVGERWWPSYFSTLQRMLAPNGRAVVQSITIDDALFPRYRARYRFHPAACLPRRHAAEPAGFRQTGREGRVCGCVMPSLLVRITHVLWPGGQPVSNSSGRLSSRSVLISDFCVYGAFIWPTVRPGFNSGCTDVMQFELEHRQ